MTPHDENRLREALAVTKGTGISEIGWSEAVRLVTAAAESTLPKQKHVECWEVRSYVFGAVTPSYCYVEVLRTEQAAHNMAVTMRGQNIASCVEVRKSTHLVPSDQPREFKRCRVPYTTILCGCESASECTKKGA